MRRGGSWICLMMALVCPFLCQGKAADALARSLAERFARAEVEPTEASACDMFDVGALKAEAHVGHAPSLLAFDCLLPPVPAESPPGPCALAAASRRDLTDRPPPTTGRRLAWLQLLVI